MSIQVLVDEIFDQEDEAGEYILANIQEFLELSAVLIPGDGDTTVTFAERCKGFKSSLDTEEKKSKNPVGGKKIGDTKDEEPDELKRVKPMIGLGKEAEDTPVAGLDVEEADRKKGNGDKQEAFIVSIKQSLQIKRDFTEAAFNGCKCPKCKEHMVKDNFSVPSLGFETFQLRCISKECGNIISKDEKLFKQYLGNAKNRIGGN